MKYLRTWPAWNWKNQHSNAKVGQSPGHDQSIDQTICRSSCHDADCNSPPQLPMQQVFFLCGRNLSPVWLYHKYVHILYNLCDCSSNIFILLVCNDNHLAHFHPLVCAELREQTVGSCFVLHNVARPRPCVAGVWWTVIWSIAWIIH